MNNTFSNHTSSCLESLTYAARYPACYLNLLISFPINSFVVWLIVSGASGTMATEFCTFNLAVNELLNSVACVLTLLSSVTDMLLKADIFFQVFSNVCRALFQTIISLERYLAVIQPVFFLRCKPLRYRVAIFSVLWILSIGFHSLSVSDPKSLVTFPSLIAFYFFLFFLLLFCFVSVLRALRQPAPGDSERQKERDSGNNMKRKAFNITLFSMLIMTSYVSFLATAPKFSLFDQRQCFITVCFITVIEMLTSLIHPLLYLKRLNKLPCLK